MLKTKSTVPNIYSNSNENKYYENINLNIHNKYEKQLGYLLYLNNIFLFHSENILSSLC